MLPNYAEEDEQIQQGLAHKYDDYTNPFKLSQGISSVFQPGIQNAQKQQMVNIDQARQNLAATAQNTLLPLQANMLTAQATNLTGETALRNYQIDQMKDAQSQLPDFLNGLSDAETNSDPSLLFKAAASSPAAVARNPGLVTDSLNRLSQQQAIKTQGITGSAAARGMDYVAQNPNANPTDFESAFTPTEGLNAAQQLQEKQAFIQGASHQQAQSSVAAAKGQIQLAAAQIRQTGQIDAATQRALSPLIQKGFFTPDALAAVGVDPDTSDKLLAAANGQPNGQGGVVPDKVAVANIATARALLNSPMPSTEQTSWANSVLNNGGTPAFQLPVYSPDTQDQINAKTDEIKGLQDALAQNQKGWMWSASDTSKALSDITQKKQELINIRKNGRISTPQDGTSSFSPNPFMKPIPANGMPASAAVPGNPQTTAALAATGGATSPSQAESTPAPAASGDIPPDALSKLDAKTQAAYTWAKANPSSPKAQQIMTALKNLVSRTNGAQ